MPKLKVLSADEIIKIFLDFGYFVENQRGSHIKLRRFSHIGTRQTLTIPNHKELDRGTLKAIYNQALRYISEDELYQHFYLE